MVTRFGIDCRWSPRLAPGQGDLPPPTSRAYLAREMTVTTPARDISVFGHRLARADVAFALTVLAAYALATDMAMTVAKVKPDFLMLVAERVFGGHLDSDALKGGVDTVNVGGHYFIALGPLQLLSYLPFAAVPPLQGVGRWIVGLLFGVPAAWLSLPLARSFGARGSDAFWIAAFTAFGTMLMYISVLGDAYYLAHAQSFLALTLFLLEWNGRRRPAALGATLAISLLARPTTVLAAIPFGLALLWKHRGQIPTAARQALLFGAPIAAAIAVYGWFNWVRFGSPFEAGYSISYMSEPDLVARRAMGIFSISQVPENLRLALLALPAVVDSPPYILPSRWGMSMLLVSPALLTAAWAGFRDRTAQLLWITAALVAVPVFLYYGGGFVQYGFRYSLDFTPFLVALMAIASRRWAARPAHILIVASIVSGVYGLLAEVVWHAY